LLFAVAAAALAVCYCSSGFSCLLLQQWLQLLAMAVVALVTCYGCSGLRLSAIAVAASAQQRRRMFCYCSSGFSCWPCWWWP